MATRKQARSGSTGAGLFVYMSYKGQAFQPAGLAVVKELDNPCPWCGNREQRLKIQEFNVEIPVSPP